MTDRSKIIDPAVEKQILKSLSQIEREHDVKILHAVESGSRAWGFHSPDSDYDVRFIYVHKRDWYLGIYPGRDVIELPIDEIYDVSGWDLKKTLHLALKSNAVVLEWLKSPIVYQSDPAFVKELEDFCCNVSEEKTLLHHYLNLAQQHFNKCWQELKPLKIKKYFYIIRPMLALRWLRKHKNENDPPMNIQKLMEQAEISIDLKVRIGELIDRKYHCNEAFQIDRIKEIDDFIMTEKEKAQQALLGMEIDQSIDVSIADIFFRKWLY